MESVLCVIPSSTRGTTSHFEIFFMLLSDGKVFMKLSGHQIKKAAPFLGGFSEWLVNDY
jgi:hypothetical protein